MSPEFRSTKIYSGPNPYAGQAVVRFAAGEALWPAQRVGHHQLQVLHDLLPALRTRRDGCGAPECFTRPGAAAQFAHLLEHVCIELQNLAGAHLGCIRALSPAPIGAAEAVVPFEDSDVCVAAAGLALELLASAGGATRAIAPANASSAPPARRIEDFLGFAKSTMLPVQDRALVAAARQRDIPVQQLCGRVLALGHGRYQRRMSATKTSLTNIVSNDLAANKDYARRVLGDLGLPVPRYERVYSAGRAVAVAERIGYPVVVKPNNSNMGLGVSVGMNDADEVRGAYKRAREFDRSVLVEKLIEGADYRMLVIDGQLRAAARRVPGHVVGDGTSTIEALLQAVNSDPRRGTGPTCSWTRIEFDEQAGRLLAGLGYTLQTVPAAGEVVYLRRNANTSDGGTAVDITDDVHPDNREIAERAARAIGLDIAGVDLLSRDITVSMWDNDGKICEINSRPGVRKHLWPAQGKPRDVLTPILDMLFPPGSTARVPIVGVTGSGDTATVSRLLAQVLAACGRHVGLAVAGQVYSGGRLVRLADRVGPAAARTILLDPQVEAAVLELLPDDLLGGGLGCDALDVAVVVNGVGDRSEPALTRRVVDAVRLAVRHTRDVICVAEGDPCIAAVTEERGAAQLCHIVRGGAGGRAGPLSPARELVDDGDSLALVEAGCERGRLPIASMLDALPRVGAEAGIRQGAALAVAAAWAIGLGPPDIDRALRGSRPLP